MERKKDTDDFDITPIVETYKKIQKKFPGIKFNLNGEEIKNSKDEIENEGKKKKRRNR